ncbi:MAG TPA: MBOAT family O-acyltransferase [Bacteroidales bacterium]|nr:MBOAT family O-acyltransferase [Bacteroidales bacterium]
MLFNTLHFLIFFVVVFVLFFTLPHKFRWVMLLAASCYFYMAFIPIYILILAFTIVVDYFAGIMIEKSHDKRKRWFLIASLVANIGILAFFKYYNFLNNNLSLLLGKFGYPDPIPALEIILPIGLSFHTFQAMSYTIEVYRGKQKAERHFGIYALYVMFYPQLVAGPIERPQNLLHQFHNKHSFSIQNLSDGLRLIIYGLFLKMVIADNVSPYVNSMYANPQNYSSTDIITALCFYSIQIYCDFCGYSLIAIGSAKSMGFNLMNNFHTPYFSRTVSEFWKRWHISLSTWFKDYLYIPLGGNRVALPRWMFNIFIVFAISGLWHGASWNFVIWGVLWGLLNVGEVLYNKLFSRPEEKGDFKIWHSIHAAKMFIIATFLWVFFRSENMEKVKLLAKSIKHNFSLNNSLNVPHLVWALLIVFLVFEIMFYNHRFDKWCEKRDPIIKWSVYIILISSIIMFAGIEDIPFIYFQF